MAKCTCRDCPSRVATSGGGWTLCADCLTHGCTPYPVGGWGVRIPRELDLSAYDCRKGRSCPLCLRPWEGGGLCVVCNLEPGLPELVKVAQEELELCDYLRQARTLSQEDVDLIEAERSRRLGPYVPHHHRHYSGEAGH